MAKIIYYLFLIATLFCSIWITVILIQKQAWIVLFIPFIGYGVTAMMWYIRKDVFQEDETYKSN